MKLITILLIFINSLVLISCIETSDEARLHEYLFGANQNGTIYNPNIRPVETSNKRLDVQVRIGLKRIFEMDEANHRVVLFSILFKKWTDDFLKWNPNDFGGIKYIYVDYSKIWTPRLELISKYANEESSPSDESIHEIYDNFPIQLFNNGTVQFTPSVHLTSECLLNDLKFPLDTQVCLFVFQMPYSSRQIKLTMNVFYTQDSEKKYKHIWKIDDVNIISAQGENKNPISVLQIKFKRQVKNILFTLPSYIVYILTLLMFILPQTSNQRIIIGSTCLIIDTILTYMISNSMSHDNIDITAWPLLGKIYLFNIILLVFSLLFSAFIINVSNSDHIRSVPDWLKKFTIKILSRIFCIQAVAYTVLNSYSFKMHDDENIAVQEHISNQLVMSSIDNNVVVRYKNANIENHDEQEDEEEEKEARKNDENKEKERIIESNKTDNTNNNLGLTSLLKKIHDHMNQIRYRLQIETYKNCKDNEWLLVGTLIDKTLFFVYCSIVIFCTLTIFRSNS